jgi:hypothetical protein
LAEKEGDGEKAFVKYNRATLAFAHGDFENGKKFLTAAIELDARSVRAYCGLSAYMSEAASADPTIRDLIEGRAESRDTQSLTTSA